MVLPFHFMTNVACSIGWITSGPLPVEIVLSEAFPIIATIAKATHTTTQRTVRFIRTSLLNPARGSEDEAEGVAELLAAACLDDIAVGEDDTVEIPAHDDAEGRARRLFVANQPPPQPARAEAAAYTQQTGHDW